ncbi:hypothetical protein EON67_08535, partial [archaeon]
MASVSAAKSLLAMASTPSSGDKGIAAVRTSPAWLSYSPLPLSACRTAAATGLIQVLDEVCVHGLRLRLRGLASVHVALGCELVSFSQSETSVVAEVRDRDGAAHRITSAYLVGADGANSLVRRLLGQDFKGKTYAEDWLVVDAKRAAEPIDHVEFICDSARPTPHMVAPGDRQRWEFKLQRGETREQMEHPD